MSQKTSTNNTSISYVQESTLGVTPDNPSFKEIPTKGSQLSGNTATVVSTAIRDDRQTDDLIVVDQTINGNIDIELSFKPYKTFLEALLQDVTDSKFITTDITNRTSHTVTDAIFSTIDESLSSASSVFTGLVPGDKITISGSVSNNGTYIVLSVPSATKVIFNTSNNTVGSLNTPIVAEAAGATVTLIFATIVSDIRFRKWDNALVATTTVFSSLSNGDQISVSGSPNVQNNGVFTVNSVVSPQIVRLSTNKLVVEEAAGNPVRLGFTNFTNDIAFTYSGGVATITSVTTDLSMFEPNASIYIKGAINAGNNGIFKVNGTQPTAHLITLVAGTVFTPEAAGANVKFRQNFFRNGNANPKSYTILKKITGLTNDALFYYRGCQVGAMNLSFATGAILSGSFTFVGLTEEATETPITGQTLTETTAYSLMNSVSSLSIESDVTSSQAAFQSFNLTVDNAINGAKQIGVLGASDLESYTLNVSASVSVYFENIQAYNKYKNATAFKVILTLVDANNNYIIITLPRCKFEKLDVPISGQNNFLMLNGTLKALRDPTLDYTIQMDVLQAI